MAGGAYKGLTIRIGADTTKLSTALRGMNSVIFKAESELRKLNKAAKLDPGNTKVIEAQIGAMATEAVAAAEKMAILKKSIAEVGEQKASDGVTTFKELADSTDSAAMSAEEALERYNKLDAELESVYKDLKEVSKIDLSEASRAGGAEYDKAVESLRRWAHESGNAEKALAWTSKTGESIDQTITRIDHMRAAWKDANKDLADAQMVESLHNAQTELIATEAKARSLARAVVELNRYSETSKLFKGADERMTLLSAAAKTAAERVERLNKAAQLNTTSDYTKKLRIDALTEQLEIAQAQADVLREKMEGYKATGIDAIAASIGNISLELKQSEEAFVAAEAEVTRLTAEYGEAKKAATRLTDAGKDGMKDALQLSAAEEAAANYKKQLDAAKVARDEAFGWWDSMKAVSEYENLKVEAVENADAQDKLLVAMRKVYQAATESDLTPRFDISKAEQLKSVLEQMGNIGIPGTAMQGLQNQLNALTVSAEGAEQRFGRLDAAFQLDTGNIDIATSRTRTLQEAFIANEREMEGLRTALDSLPSDKIDHLAISSGNVSGMLEDATRAMSEAADRTRGYEDTIKALEDEIEKLSRQEFISDADAEKIANLDAQIKLLKTSMQSFEEQNREAVNYLERANVTNTFVEWSTRIDECEVKSRQLRDAFGGFRMESGVSLQLSTVREEMTAISAGADTAKARFDALNHAAQVKPHSLNIALQRTRAFAEATDAAKKKAENLKQQLDAYKANGIYDIAKNTTDAAIALEKANRKVDDLQRELAKAEKQFGETSEQARELGTQLQQALMEANSAAAVNECREIETALVRVETEAREMRDAMKVGFGEIGSAAVIAAQQIGQLAQQGLREVVTASNDIDAAYRDLTKTFNAGEDEYKQLYDAAMKYSQSNVTSADTMLEMESIAAQLGVGIEGGADAIQHFAEVAANLDVATNIDAETIALQMGQIVNVMSDLDNTKPDTIEGFADALVRLGNTMPTQESNIMQITQRLSAIGDVTRFTTPQLMGWASAIASTGQKSEAAASGIATTITNIAKAVSMGDKGLQEVSDRTGISVAELSAAIEAGGDKLKKYADAAGMSTKELKEAGSSSEKLSKYAEIAGLSTEKFIEQWRTAPSDTLQRFIEGLKDSGDDLFATLMDLDINGVRQNQTLAALAQTVDTVTGAIDSAEEAFNGGGDAATEAEKKAQGFSGTLAKLKNSAQILAGTFGESLVPWMKTGMEYIQRLTTWVQNLDDKTVGTIVTVGGLATAVSLAATAFSPFISAVGGLVSGAISLAVAGLAGMVGPITTAGELFTAISLVAEAAAGALMAFASAGGFVIGAVALIAAAFAGDYLTSMHEAKESSERFQGTIDGIKGTTEGLHRELLFGKDAVKEYAEKWSAARKDLDDFYESQHEHIDAMNESRSSASDNVAMLEKYREIIEKNIGVGEKHCQNIGELQWALDGLASITGETYEAEDILSGKMQDEAGNAINLRDAINDLIEAKKKESQLDAITNMRTEAVQGQMEAKEAVDETRQAYQDLYDTYRQNMGLSDVDMRKWMEDQSGKSFFFQDDKYKELMLRKGDWDEAKALYDEWTEKIKKLDEAYKGIYDAEGYANEGQYGVREGIMKTTEAMEEALKTSMHLNDNGIKRLAQTFQDANISTEDFARVSGEDFAAMCERANGDTRELTRLLVDYIAKLPEMEEEVERAESAAEATAEQMDELRQEKQGVSDTPANANVESNATEATEEIVETKEELQDADGETAEMKLELTTEGSAEEATEGLETTTTSTISIVAEVDDSKLDDLNKKLDKLSNTTSKPKVDVTIPDGDKRQVNNLSKKLQDISKTWTLTVSTTVYADNFYTLLRKLNENNGKRFSMTMTTYQNTVKGSVGGSATGGYMPNRVPKHADGFIATKPTLTKYGWIGEDGAEYYSGGSLVPLTNRKYSQPYIDDISDAVAKKLGPLSSGNQITVTVTGVSGPDEVADAIARKLTLLGL